LKVEFPLISRELPHSEIAWDFANRELCCAGLYVAILSVLVD
jgi:hypothetical protein